MSERHAIVRGACLALAWIAASCDACGSADDTGELARLIEIAGTGIERDFAKSAGLWQRAEVGARFHVGDGVRSDAGSIALLALADASELKLAPSSAVRFLAEESAGEQALSVETGEAILTAGGSDLRLRTQVGTAVLKAKSRMVISHKGDKSAAYSVQVGELQFRDQAGSEQSLRAGEDIEVGIGMAVLRANRPTEEARAASIQVSVGEGSVQQRGANGKWEALARGEHALAQGTSVRVPAGTSVTVARGEDQTVVTGPSEIAVGAGGRMIELRTGRAELRAQARDVEVSVPGGVIVAKSGGSVVSLRLAKDHGELTVTSGSATFDDGNGQHAVGSGEDHAWDFASAQEQPSDNTSSIPGDYEPGPEHFNVSARAGSSFVVHAPEVPVAIGFEFEGKCSGEGFVELARGKQRGRGTGRASLLFSAGSRGYQVRCADAKGHPGKVVARGSVTVLRDAGTAKLPASAPTSFVEADGRSYTIYYQHQLPAIDVRWPNAPKVDKYTLEIDGRAIDLKKPSHVIKSGGLRDGTHTLTFSAQDRRSRAATIEVRFDNAAPKASLFSPADRSWTAGATVTVEGVALRGWKVELPNGMIQSDASDRFSGQVTTTAERPDVVVRLSHPRLGTHYYVRRASGSR